MCVRCILLFQSRFVSDYQETLCDPDLSHCSKRLIVALDQHGLRTNHIILYVNLWHSISMICDVTLDYINYEWNSCHTISYELVDIYCSIVRLTWSYNSIQIGWLNLLYRKERYLDRWWTDRWWTDTVRLQYVHNRAQQAWVSAASLK